MTSLTSPSPSSPTFSIPLTLPKLTGKWSRPSTDLFVFVTDDLTTKGNIAGFDLDGTIVKPHRTKFPRTIDDNVLMPHRIEILKQLINRDDTLVIFTNQKSRNDEKRLFNYRNFKIPMGRLRLYQRVNHAITLLLDQGIQLICLMATGDDEYRKPNTGMWKVLSQMLKIEAAFYCGDAAGRTGDFSDSDLKFAENIGIKFYTPEEIFT